MSALYCNDGAQDFMMDKILGPSDDCFREAPLYNLQV